MRRWSKALMAAVAEVGPRRLRTIGLSPAERQRIRRAEDRDFPVFPRKQDCPGCVAAREADRYGRWPIGDCLGWATPDGLVFRECVRRTARRAS